MVIDKPQDYKIYSNTRHTWRRWSLRRNCLSWGLLWITIFSYLLQQKFALVLQTKTTIFVFKKPKKISPTEKEDSSKRRQKFRDSPLHGTEAPQLYIISAKSLLCGPRCLFWCQRWASVPSSLTGWSMCRHERSYRSRGVMERLRSTFYSQVMSATCGSSFILKPRSESEGMFNAVFWITISTGIFAIVSIVLLPWSLVWEVF